MGSGASVDCSQVPESRHRCWRLWPQVFAAPQECRPGKVGEAQVQFAHFVWFRYTFVALPAGRRAAGGPATGRHRGVTPL